MKKVLSTVAALGLVAGLASTAAAVEFTMSGKYMVEGAYLSDARTYPAGTDSELRDLIGGTSTLSLAGTALNVMEEDGRNNTSDSYWLHTFEIKPTMKVNDKVSMSSVIRLAQDSIWGGQTAAGDVEGNQMSEDNNSGIYVHQLYMDYASPIGKVRIGRTPAGTYGTSFMDSDKRADRVMLYAAGLEKPWSTVFYLEKVKDNFATGTFNITTGVGNADDGTDVDSDTYVARLFYNTDTTDAGIHYGYTRDMTNNATIDSDVKHALTAYGKFKMDNYFLNAELTHFMGGKEYDNTATLDRDYDSWAGMMQVGGKFDALTPSLMYFYAQGQDMNHDGNGDDVENALGSTGTGDMFEPLYILTGRHTGLLNNDLFNGGTTLLSKSGVHGVVAAADYAVSKELTLHGAIGWAQADEIVAVNQDDDYGWEYNVGAAYKLLDNLTYEAHFGYLDTGDYFNFGDTTDNTNNVYILTHSLTMTF